jgi:integrase
MKSARRSPKAGGLYKRASDGMWVAAVTLPSGPDGKRRRKVVVRAKYQDAQRELTRLNKEKERAGDLSTASPTLTAWIDAWWDRYAIVDLRPKTRESYRSKIERYIKPSIGRVKLEHLGVTHVHRLRDYITRDLGLSTTTARQAFAILSSILSAAETEGKIGRNPCSLVSAPAKRAYKVTYLTSAQARDFMAFSDPGDGTVPIDLAMRATAFLTGVRPAERLGLRRPAIDLDTGRFTVSWQLQRLSFEHGCDGTCGRKRGGNCPARRIVLPDSHEVEHVEGGLYLTRPKTSAGWREFTMPDLLREMFEAYLEAREPGMCDLLFTREGGRPIDPSADLRNWNAGLAAAGLPAVDQHSARHSCNTILTELGYPVDVRQKILGHASKAVNEAVYTHTSDARVTEATAALGTAMDWRT